MYVYYLATNLSSIYLSAYLPMSIYSLPYLSSICLSVFYICMYYLSVSITSIIYHLSVELSIHPSTTYCWLYFSGGILNNIQGSDNIHLLKLRRLYCPDSGTTWLKGSWVQLDLLKELQKNPTSPVSPEKDGKQKTCIYFKAQEDNTTAGSACSRSSRVVEATAGRCLWNLGCTEGEKGACSQHFSSPSLTLCDKAGKGQGRHLPFQLSPSEGRGRLSRAMNLRELWPPGSLTPQVALATLLIVHFIVSFLAHTASYLCDSTLETTEQVRMNGLTSLLYQKPGHKCLQETRGAESMVQPKGYWSQQFLQPI